MRDHSRPQLAGWAPVALVLIISTVGCAGSRPRIVQPGPPGTPSRPITSAEAAGVAGVKGTSADVQFIQGMMLHHAQALEMTALVRQRSTRQPMRLLADRIDASQTDEIAFMRTWLSARGHAVPDAHAHEGHAMPGMLTHEEMGRLARATDGTFEPLFLALMIKHHEGAVKMVDDLFANAGGQDPEVFGFASDVVADQRMEIQRMTAMSRGLQP